MEEGTVVRFEYTLRVEGQVTETSTEELAKKYGIHQEGRTYEPLTFGVGGRQIISGLEEEVVKHKVGDSFTIDIPAVKAYGERDIKKVQTVPMGQFKKQGVKPEVGQIINWNQSRAIVTQVAGGRVRIDGNHELAGKALSYDVEVKSVITDEDGKLEATLKMMFPEGVAFTNDDDFLTIEVPDQAKFSQDWPMMKFRVLTQVRQAIGLHKPVKLVEIYPALQADEDGKPVAVEAEAE
jgi:FKBP-type peptidyl-prolyl cis-trans isomerase 2